VDVVEVDVVGVEPSQGGVELFDDGFAGQAGAAGAVVHLVVHLGGQHDVLAAGVGLDGAADELLRCATAIAVGGVPEGDAELDCLPEERL
jgi:hypothetical protein